MEPHPELQHCLAHCLHCGIRFLTHPRNAGRLNLRCPFGCRQHHRQERSNQRSAAYYRTASGKKKKKLLNGRRSSSAAECERRTNPIEQAASPNEQLPDELSGQVELQLEGVVLRESSLARSRMLPYVRMVVRLIEGLELSCRELAGLLRQALRQHSIASRSRLDYVLGFLHQHPP